MIKKELHLVIVWDAAKDAYNKIIEVIDEKFTINLVFWFVNKIYFKTKYNILSKFISTIE